jgi:hypothetical protein
MNRRLLQITLIVIGIAQIFFGAVFIFAPAKFSGMLDLPETPQWAYWMFGMFSARAFGFAYGMFLAARDPMKHVHWIQAMIGVQLIDWLATMYFVLDGAVTLAQVTSASYLPLIFIAMLVIFYPRQTTSAPNALA